MKQRHVYLIGPDEIPVTKVGLAVDIQARLDCLQTGNPYRLHLRDSVLLPFNKALMVERKILREFAEVRMVGEWLKTDWKPVAEYMHRADPADHLAQVTTIRAAREALGMSQFDLAGLIDCSQGMVAHYETGFRVPGWQKAKKIAEVLGVSVELIRPDIFGDDRSAA